MWPPREIRDVAPEPYRPENEGRFMWVTDANGKLLPPKEPPAAIFAVLDSKKCLSGTDCGAVISTYKTRTVANKASAKIPHSRVLQLKPSGDWKTGDHISGVYDVIWDNRRWS